MPFCLLVAKPYFTTAPARGTGGVMGCSYMALFDLRNYAYMLINGTKKVKFDRGLEEDEDSDGIRKRRDTSVTYNLKMFTLSSYTLQSYNEQGYYECVIYDKEMVPVEMKSPKSAYINAECKYSHVFLN